MFDSRLAHTWLFVLNSTFSDFGRNRDWASMGEKRLQSRRRWFRPRPKHPLPLQQAQCKYPGKAVNKEIRRWGHHPKTASLGDQLGRRGLLRARRRERSSVVALWCDLFCIMWGVMPVTCDTSVICVMASLSHTCDTYHPFRDCCC